MNKVLLITLSLFLLFAGIATAANVEITGDYRFRYDSLEATVPTYQRTTDVTVTPPTSTTQQGYTVKNSSLFTNRIGLNLKATAVEDVKVKARLVMYKITGHQTDDPALGWFFADRFGDFNDGTAGHVPSDSIVRVDYAFATISNIMDMPLWFSVGRRPSTGGVPGNIRDNREKKGASGIPNILVDYAFDGATIGYAPDIDALPGAYAKLCFGRGYESGFRGTPFSAAAGKDTDFIGLNFVPYDEDNLHIEVQYQIGKNIFDYPSDSPYLSTNLGNIEWIGGVVTTKIAGMDVFASAAVSKTDPNDNLTGPDIDQNGAIDAPVAGLLYNAGSKEDHTGNAFYIGARYDLTTTTKVGFEYNRGSKYWISMIPAGDDIWTSKLGTRGDVYEAYVIKELGREAVSKNGKAFFKLGYQHYEFEYTGSNNWVGAPVDIDAVNTAPGQQVMPPVKDADDIYATFEVRF